MAKDKLIFQGTVIEVLRDCKFKVRVTSYYIVECKLCGKMFINNISILLDDNVSIEVSEYDLLKCRIIRRL